MIGDRKTENILSSIKDIDLNISSMKSTQYLGGASFVTYVTSSEDLYDFQITIPQSYKTAKVTFTYPISASTKNHIVSLTAYFRIDNPKVMAAPVIEDSNSFQIATPFVDGSGLGFTSWIIQLANGSPSSKTFYFKFFFSGTTSGTFNAVAL